MIGLIAFKRDAKAVSSVTFASQLQKRGRVVIVNIA